MVRIGWRPRGQRGWPRREATRGRKAVEVLASGATGMLLVAGAIALFQGNAEPATGQFPGNGATYATAGSTGGTLIPAPYGAVAGGSGGPAGSGGYRGTGGTGGEQTGGAEATAPSLSSDSTPSATPSRTTGPSQKPTSPATGTGSPSPSSSAGLLGGLLGGLVGGVAGAAGSALGGLVGGSNG